MTYATNTVRNIEANYRYFGRDGSDLAKIEILR